jgi:hypothetical protein
VQHIGTTNSHNQRLCTSNQNEFSKRQREKDRDRNVTEEIFSFFGYMTMRMRFGKVTVSQEFTLARWYSTLTSAELLPGGEEPGPRGDYGW